MMILHDVPTAPVWVLDEREGAAAGQAMALAGRLDLPMLRLPVGPGGRALDQALAAGRAGTSPALVISAGMRAGLQALALRARFGARILHCTRHANPLLPFDVMVRPAATAPTAGDPLPLAPVPRIIPVLGPLGIVSPALLARARALWRDRLDHLPRPRIALLVRTGSGRMADPLATGRLGARVAALAAAEGGTVLASAWAAIGPAANAALANALRPALHLLYRSDEPGEDPTLGFLAMADAVVVGGASPQALSEAAAASVPVFADPLDDPCRDGRRLLRALERRGDIRAFTGTLPAWPRQPLDEAGRVAAVLGAMLRA